MVVVVSETYMDKEDDGMKVAGRVMRVMREIKKEHGRQ